MERCGQAQGLGQGVAVRGFLGETQRHVACALRLLGIAERPEHPGIHRTAVHPRSGDEVKRGVETALVALADRVRLLELFPRLGELAKKMQRRSQHPMSRHADAGIVMVLGQRQALLAEFACLVELGTEQVNIGQADKHRDKLRRAPELSAQFPRPKVDLLHLRIGKALGGDEGWAERDQEIQLHGVALRPRGQGLEQSQSLA
jgi:hypothetical protein